jgi:hypothetical protein
MRAWKNVYLLYVAVGGSKIAVVLGWSGSEGLAGPGNTGCTVWSTSLWNNVSSILTVLKHLPLIFVPKQASS